MIRTEAGVGLRALARAIDVSSTYLSRVENGRDPPPTADRLRAIAGVLDVPPDVLVELAGRTGVALDAYLERVPAASSLFLDIARRDLNADQIARLAEFIDTELPEVEPSSPPVESLRALIPPSRIQLNVKCRTLDGLIDAGAALCARRVAGVTATEIAEQLRARESDCSTALGNGLAVPHARFVGAPALAALVTPARPLAGDTPDGEPIRAAVVLVAGTPGEHLMMLALVARLAARNGADHLRQARSPRHARAILACYG